MKKIFILLPSPHPVGPAKGAYALANALADLREVCVVTLKAGSGVSAPLDKRVEQISLAHQRGDWPGWIESYRKILAAAGGRRLVSSLSLLFSADVVNGFCTRHASVCSSVRGNLIRNYRMDYGLAGIALGTLHLASLRRFDHIVAMTAPMARQIRRFAGRTPEIIGNFVDEAPLERYRCPGRGGPGLNFVFLGSLSHRKQPLLVVRAVAQLRRNGVDAQLDIAGDGPLRAQVQATIATLGLTEAVRVHGHLADPYPMLAGADAMVLPSLSEGVSRAALEALHLGVPCVLREADGNGALLHSENGALFDDDSQLPTAMLAAARLGKGIQKRASLVPPAFRQREAADRYLELLEQS